MFQELTLTYGKWGSPQGGACPRPCQCSGLKYFPVPGDGDGNPLKRGTLSKHHVWLSASRGTSGYDVYREYFMPTEKKEVGATLLFGERTVCFVCKKVATSHIKWVIIDYEERICCITLIKFNVLFRNFIKHELTLQCCSCFFPKCVTKFQPLIRNAKSLFQAADMLTVCRQAFSTPADFVSDSVRDVALDNFF